MLQIRFVSLACSFLVAGCVGASSGGGGGGSAVVGGAVGSACTTQGQPGCTMANGLAVTELCTGGLWAQVTVCPAGNTCTIQADGGGNPVAACVAGAAVTTDTATTRATDAAPDSATVAPTDSGSADTKPPAADTVAPVDTTPPSNGYKFVTIDGSPWTEPDCNATNSPGPDIDVVALYRGNILMGVGKPGTVVFKSGAKNACADHNKHNNPKDVEGGLTTKMYTTATPDTGYFGLSDGTVSVRIGACQVSTADIKSCDGTGPALEIKPGDELDIYEVDATYKKGSGSFAEGIASDACKCIAESYELFVSKEDGAGLISLGKFEGSKGQIKVQ